MKKIISAILCISMMFISGSFTAYAGETMYDYDFKMSASEPEISAGDTVKVSVLLEKTDGFDSFIMYAAAYSLIYDADFFTLVSDLECSSENEKGITYLFNENSEREGWSEVDISVKSSEFEGKEWKNPSELISLTFRAEKVGASAIQCKNSAVGNIYGGNENCSSNNVTITVVKNSDGIKNDTDSSNGSDISGAGSDLQNGNASASSGSGGGASNLTDNSQTNAGNENSTGGAADSVDTDLNASEIFSDVNESDWFCSAVSYAVSKGLFKGTSDDEFFPNGYMSRAMLVTALWRLEGSPSVLGDSEFTDVAENSWYAEAVSWASKNNIVNGVAADKFAPNDNVTREQIAAMLYRYAQFAGKDISSGDTLNVFNDKDSISKWAQPAVKWAVEQKIITGVTESTLMPKSTATRAQAAAMLMRFA